MEVNDQEHKSNRPGQTPFSQTYFHGTKANLKIGDFIEVGLNSNYGQNRNAKYIYLPAGRSQVQASLKKSLQQFWLKDAALHANPAYEEHVIAVLRRQ